jgi:hypothetical protein
MHTPTHTFVLSDGNSALQLAEQNHTFLLSDGNSALQLAENSDIIATLRAAGAC